MKRIVDTLQEKQFLPGNCPISHPEEAQENIILKESLLFFFLLLPRIQQQKETVWISENSSTIAFRIQFDFV